MRSLANLGLQAFFDLGEDGWNDEFDLNFLKLSVLTQGGFIDKVAATPGAPVDKDVYVFDETHPTQANKVAVYDVDTWKYFTPNEGWMLYNRTDNYFEKFDGAVWAQLQTGGVPEAPVDTKTYGRKDAAWAEIVGGGGALAPLSLALAPLPAFQNAWTNYNAATHDVLKVVKSGRIVSVTGFIKGGANATVAFTLPVGWRPEKELLAAARTAGGLAYISFRADGTVFIDGLDSTTWTAIDAFLIVTEAEAWNGGGIPPAGVTFPLGPVPGQRHYRTDRNIEYVWDGVRWLSTQLFTLNNTPGVALQPQTATLGNLGFIGNPWATKYDVFVEEAVLGYYLSAAGNWNFQVIKNNGAGAGDLVAFNALATVANWTPVRTAINAVMASNVVQLELTATENSGAGIFYFSLALTYRLIG